MVKDNYFCSIFLLCAGSVSVLRGDHGTWTHHGHPEETFSPNKLLANARQEIFGKNYWLAPDRSESAEFVLSLGCAENVNMVERVISRNNGNNGRNQYSTFGLSRLHYTDGRVVL